MQKSERGSTYVGDSIRTAGEKASHKIEEFSSKAGKKGDELAKRGSEIAGQVQKEAEVYTEALTDYIKKNPVKATLIAGGIGWLIGKIFKH